MSARHPKSSHPMRDVRAQQWKITRYWDGPWKGPMPPVIVTMEELATDMGISVATAEASIQELEAVGAVTRERVY